jgi:general nucleoside transport system permease protein
MDALAFLYGIPILGLVFQFAGYVVQIMPSAGPIFLATTAPIALGALCGVMNERSGVVNIGIEGMMLFGAFAAAITTSALVAQMGGGVGMPFGANPALIAGVGAAILAGMAVSALHAWLSITIRADQIISGTIINIVALGLTGYLNQLISKTSPPNPGTFAPFAPPEWLVNLPIVGWVFNMFLSQGPIAMSVIVLVVVLQVLLFRSRWGLRTRAVGEHPRAAETVGIDVIRLRYRNVILGGVFAGLAGAYLALESAGSFQSGMTNGRGFIALAALIVGRWTPIGAFGAALLFTASEALERAIRFGAPSGQLGEILTAIPIQFYNALPYLITIVVLAGVVGRSVAPAADGQPYEKETAH